MTVTLSLFFFKLYFSFFTPKNILFMGMIFSSNFYEKLKTGKPECDLFSYLTLVNGRYKTPQQPFSLIQAAQMVRLPMPRKSSQKTSVPLGARFTVLTDHGKCQKLNYHYLNSASVSISKFHIKLKTMNIGKMKSSGCNTCDFY